MLAQHERPTRPLHAVTELASSSPAARITRPDTVKAGLTPKRPRRQIENDEYSAFVRRILCAYSRRVGNGDVEALVLMLGLPQVAAAAGYDLLALPCPQGGTSAPPNPRPDAMIMFRPAWG